MFRHGTMDLQLIERELNGSDQPDALPVDATTLGRGFQAARELDHLAQMWPELSDSVRRAILVLVEAGTGFEAVEATERAAQ